MEPKVQIIYAPDERVYSIRVQVTSAILPAPNLAGLKPAEQQQATADHRAQQEGIDQAAANRVREAADYIGDMLHEMDVVPGANNGPGYTQQPWHIGLDAKLMNGIQHAPMSCDFKPSGSEDYKTCWAVFTVDRHIRLARKDREGKITELVAEGDVPQSAIEAIVESARDMYAPAARISPHLRPA